MNVKLLFTIFVTIIFLICNSYSCVTNFKQSNVQIISRDCRDYMISTPLQLKACLVDLMKMDTLCTYEFDILLYADKTTHMLLRNIISLKSVILLSNRYLRDNANTNSNNNNMHRKTMAVFKGFDSYFSLFPDINLNDSKTEVVFNRFQYDQNELKKEVNFIVFYMTHKLIKGEKNILAVDLNYVLA